MGGREGGRDTVEAQRNEGRVRKILTAEFSPHSSNNPNPNRIERCRRLPPLLFTPPSSRSDSPRQEACQPPLSLFPPSRPPFRPLPSPLLAARPMGPRLTPVATRLTAPFWT